ncbi:tetratricopeptide repeat protein [Brachyspira sp.]|uniref:tetratricopeptide repeat protein n=1 Tax=Brachyspira sp. TaxID=1977261 RepID=UPI003D7E4FA4
MKKIFVFLSVFVFYSISCASVLKISPEEERYPQIIAEKAYTEFNNKKYKRARSYYQYIIDNFDRENYSKEVAWAYYEIGFCYYYQRKYKDALNYFNIVMNDFAVLPPKMLAQKVMQDIYEKKPKLKPIEVMEEIIEDIESE